MRYTQVQLGFIRANHKIVNYACADALLHNMGLASYADILRAMAAVEVDHVHCGSRYWLTGDIIDAGNARRVALGMGEIA